MQAVADQILNAKSFKEHGYSSVIFEEDLTPESLLNAVNELYENQTLLALIIWQRAKKAMPYL